MYNFLRNMLCVLGAVVITASVTPAFAAACASYASVQPPAKDLPSDALSETLSDCDAENAYYGFEGKADYVLARHCAYTKERYDILSMLYANGKAVEKNTDLAIHFACKFGGAAAETEGRVQHLEQIRHEAKAQFDICDDATSGRMVGICTARQKRLEKKPAAAPVENAKNQAALEALSRSHKAFFDARIKQEIDTSGTMRASLITEEQSALTADFNDSLKAFAAGSFPQFSKAQYAEADKRLNALYKQIQASPNTWGTVTKEGIKATQKTWLKYRDAWVKYVKAQYPQVSEESVKTWLTEKRIKMLEAFQ